MYSYIFFLILLSKCNHSSTQIFSKPKLQGKAINVGLYYEAFNQDSINFITSQLNFVTESFFLIGSIDFVPWGRTTYNDYTNTFTCNMGPEECHADRLHACACYFHTQTPLQLLQFINCTVQDPNWKTNPAESANLCANQIDGWHDAYPEIEFCSILNDTTDLNIFLAMRDKTSALNPPFNNLPYITVNGVKSNEAQNDLISGINSGINENDCSFPTTSQTTTPTNPFTTQGTTTPQRTTTTTPQGTTTPPYTTAYTTLQPSTTSGGFPTTPPSGCPPTKPIKCKCTATAELEYYGNQCYTQSQSSCNK